MASYYWIKLYHEILDDPKMGLLPDDLWRLTIELFLMAGELDQCGQLPSTEEIAWRLRRPCNATLQNSLQALQDRNILALQDNSTWFVIHFEERQKAETSAERVRRHRERQKKQAETTKKSENGDVTKRYTDIDIDRDRDKDTTTAARLTSFYLSSVNPTGKSSKLAADRLNDILGTYNHADIDYAVTEAIDQGADSLKYIEAICKRRQNGQPDKPANKTTTKGRLNGRGKVVEPTAEVIELGQHVKAFFESTC